MVVRQMEAGLDPWLAFWTGETDGETEFVVFGQRRCIYVVH